MANDVVPEGYTLEPPAGTELPAGYKVELPAGKPVSSLTSPRSFLGNLGSGGNLGLARAGDAVLNAPQHVWNLAAELWNQQEKPKSWGQIPQYEPPSYLERAARASGAVKE